MLARQRAQFANREEIPRGVGQVGEGDHPCTRCDRLPERPHVVVGPGMRAQRLDFAHGVSETPALGLPRQVVAGMVVAHDHDFVALAQLQAGRHPVVGLAGVARDEDLLRRDPEELGQAVAGGLLHAVHLAAEAGHRLAVHALGVVVDRPQGARGRRAQVGRVHHRQFGWHEELGAHLVPVHRPARAAASGGRPGRRPARETFEGGMAEQGRRSSCGEEAGEIASIHG